MVGDDLGQLGQLMHVGQRRTVRRPCLLHRVDEICGTAKTGFHATSREVARFQLIRNRNSGSLATL